jgi:chromosome partitioning protein
MMQSYQIWYVYANKRCLDIKISLLLNIFMSKILCVFSNKGGSGKTTLSVHFALAMAGRGKRVALLDVDPQATAVEWLRRRPTELPSPLAVPCPGRDAVKQALSLAKAEGFDYIVLDLPPHSTAQIAWLLKDADLIVVPVRPTAADLVTIKQTVDLVIASGRPAGFVLNSIKPNLLESREALPLLTEYGLPIIGALGDRVAFYRGLPAGLGAHELGDASATEQVNSLADKIAAKLRGAK